MSPNHTTTAPSTSNTRREAEALLKDLALVLRMTAQVKGEILASEPPRVAARRAGQATPAMAAAAAV